MSFYLEVPFVDINRQVAVDIPAPTNSGGYNFEIEFEIKLVGSELVVAGTSLSSTSNIFFLKSSILEYRNTGNTTINMTHGVNASDWHVYRFVFTGTGAGNIAFYVDGLFKANYTPSSSIATQALGALFGLGGNSSRTGDFRYFQFTDFNNSAANRMYDARAYTAGDTVLQETANNADGTFSTAWAALPPNFVADGPVTTNYTITAETVTDPHTAGEVTLIYTGSGTAYSITADAVTDSHAANDVNLDYLSVASISSEPLYNNTNDTTGLLANTALDYVAIYDNVTGALVLRVTGLSTNASGIFTVSDALLTPGTTYKLDWQVTTTGVARMPVKAAV